MELTVTRLTVAVVSSAAYFERLAHAGIASPYLPVHYDL